MKIELGLKTGIALPLLAILIIGMSILVVFNYLSLDKYFTKGGSAEY